MEASEFAVSRKLVINTANDLKSVFGASPISEGRDLSWKEIKSDEDRTYQLSFPLDSLTLNHNVY